MSLRARWRLRKQSWIDRRHPRRAICKTGMRSIYILPSRAGFALLFFLVFIFVLAANYQNALIFGLFFWLVSLAILNLHYTHNNISGLTIRCTGSRNATVGGAVEFDIEVSRDDRRGRHAIDLSFGEDELSQSLTLTEERSQRVTLNLPVNRRGYAIIPRITLSSVYPLGFARTWSYAHLTAHALVYPAAVDAGIPAIKQTTLQSEDDTQVIPGVTDFDSLRRYAPGDRLSRVHWPASTRSGSLQIKQFVDPVAQDEWVRWDDFVSLPTEQRLQHMAYIIGQMQQQHLQYGLEMPDVRITPDSGQLHYHQCNSALARFAVPEPRYVE